MFIYLFELYKITRYGPSRPTDGEKASAGTVLENRGGAPGGCA